MYIPVSVSAGEARLHGNLASAMSDAVYGITVTDAAPFDLVFSKLGDSAGPPPSSEPRAGYMTKGQRFTVLVRNKSGGPMGTVNFPTSHFRTAGEFDSPASGKSRSISFVFDGSYAIEVIRGVADVPKDLPN
jgi:hypothetical protein